jgi:hypothetical protein
MGLWTGSTGVGSRVYGLHSTPAVDSAICIQDLSPRKGYLQVLIFDVRIRSDGGAVGSSRGRRRLALTVVRHGRAWRLIGVWVFSSHGGRFQMMFAPTGSQQRGELD